MFNEYIYYVMNDIQKPFKMGIHKYAEHMFEIFKFPSYPHLPEERMSSTIKLPRIPGKFSTRRILYARISWVAFL